MLQVDDDIFLAIPDDDEEASFLLLMDVSLLWSENWTGNVHTCAPFRINAGIRESLKDISLRNNV